MKVPARRRRGSRRFICVSCPLGCELSARLGADGAIDVSGHRCKRGVAYARDELTDPRRTVTTTVLVAGGAIALLPVRTRASVPVASLHEVVRAAARAVVRAPVNLGDIVLADVAGTGVDLVAARSCRIGKAGEEDR